MTVSWTPRAGELADAALARDGEVGGSGRRALIAVLVALLAATMFTSRWTAALGCVLGFFALLLAFYRGTKPLVQRRWSTLLTANPTLAEPCSVTLDSTGVHLSSARFSSTRLWSAFSSWSDTPSSVVLAASGSPSASILVIPHRACEGELPRVRSLVEDRLGPSQTSSTGIGRRGWTTWLARLVVVGCLLVPLGVAMARVHDQGGEWRLWPSEAPPELSHDGATYVRQGATTTARPPSVTGSDYTPGGGLVMVSFPPVGIGPAPELWVLDHNGAVQHYVIAR